MKEGEQGKIKSTIFGAPCGVTPEFSDQELRENYLGCQNLPTAEWLSLFTDDRRRRWSSVLIMIVTLHVHGLVLYMWQ